MGTSGRKCHDAITNICRFMIGLCMHSLSTLTSSDPESPDDSLLWFPQKRHEKKIYTFFGRCKLSDESSFVDTSTFSSSCRMSAPGFLAQNTNQTAEDLKLSSDSLPL